MIVQSYQNYCLNLSTGFTAHSLKNKKAMPINNNSGVKSPVAKDRRQISSGLDRNSLNKRDYSFAGEWSSVGSIGKVTNLIVEDRQQFDSWPDWKILKKHDSISTVEWLRDKWGADGTFDLHHPDWEKFDKSEIEKWVKSDDAVVRTVGRICLVYFNGNPYMGVGGAGRLAGPDDCTGDGCAIHKSDMQTKSDSKFWKDYVLKRLRNSTSNINRPGEEINQINWHDAYERAIVVNARFDWLKMNWAAYNKKTLQENKKILVPKKYWKMISDLFPLEEKDQNGYMHLTKEKIDTLLYDLNYIQTNLYHGFDPGMEAYAKYLNWIHESVGWNDWSINNGS